MVKLKNFESFLYGQQDSLEMDKEMQSVEYNMMLSRSLVDERAGPNYTAINNGGLDMYGLQAAPAHPAPSLNSSGLQKGVNDAALHKCTQAQYDIQCDAA